MRTSDVEQLRDQVVARVEQSDARSVAVHLESGSLFLVTWNGSGLDCTIRERESDRAVPRGSGPRPISRQRAYLEFIGRYIARFGVSPAESHVQQHFMVSAPSVHQMIRTIERPGFIAHDRGGPALARSIRIVVDDL